MKALLFVAQCARSGTIMFALDMMNLWRSDWLFLVLGLATIFFFWHFCKKAHAPTFFMVGDGSTLR
jgi:hypothetical protein